MEDDEEKAEVDDGVAAALRGRQIGALLLRSTEMVTTTNAAASQGRAVGGWDFFNLFYVVQEVAAVAISNEDMRTMREREGIPELEEAETRGQRRRRTPRPPKQQKLRSEWPIKKRPKTCAG